MIFFPFAVRSKKGLLIAVPHNIISAMLIKVDPANLLLLAICVRNGVAFIQFQLEVSSILFLIRL